jgi:hypothetical protein
MAGKDHRRRKSGRYTPPSSQRLTSSYRSGAAMTPGPLRMTDDPTESALQEAAFFADGVTPEGVFALFPTQSGGGSVDARLPPTLVALVDEAHWPGDLQEAIGQLMAARSAHQGEEWLGVVEYSIGWSSIFRVGKPREIVVAATKLTLHVRAPVVFRQSFIFDITQVLPTIEAVVNGGVFALGTSGQVEYLVSPERTYADVIEMLPVFELPRSQALAQIVSLTAQASR